MNDSKLTIKLKQHTPIIHFQHYQNGATLRASELKPKLDKYLIKILNLTETKNINGKNEKVPKEIYKKWFNNKEKLSLNYKVKIASNGISWEDYIERPKERDGKFIQKLSTDGSDSTQTNPYPLFFGNMGMNYYEKDTIKKFEFANDGVELTIHSFNLELNDKIKNNFSDFLALANFGNRQGKGFGSFYIDKNDNNYKQVNEKLFNYKFEISISDDKDFTKKFQNIFNQIDLFYRALRSGINQKTPVYEIINGKRQIKKDGNGIFEFTDVFYFKSLLFLYFKSQGIQWEKKTIKENFFLNDGYKGKNIAYYGLKTQQAQRLTSDVLTYSNANKKLVKDLLGLSSEESWFSYNNSIKKIEAKDEEIGGKILKVKKDKKEDQILRFNSPIFFKIIETDVKGKYEIFIKLDDSIPILGKWFIIEDKFGKTFPLQIPTAFKLQNFFDFLLDKSKFDISTHVEKHFPNTSEYKKLEKIFSSLSKI